MNHCPDCVTSTQQYWGSFNFKCPGCRARMAARSPEFRASREAKVLTPGYLMTLKLLDVTHKQAKVASDLDFRPEASGG